MDVDGSARYSKPKRYMRINLLGEADEGTEEITLQTIEKIRDFMCADLDKTIALHHTSSKGAPNFMLALVLCCYTHFWGKLMLHPEGDDKRTFDAFFCRLGAKYKDNI